MFENLKYQNILFIDVETVAQNKDYATLDNRIKELWAKKMRWHMENEEKSAEALYDRAAIWAEFGKIVCISVGNIISINNGMQLRLKSFYGHNEKMLLESFALMINTHFSKKHHQMCAHNGKEFDFPYISRRMLVNDITLPKVFDTAGKKPWEVNHIDTLELWKFGDYKHYTSLDLLAAIFNIPSPKAEMDGSMVNQTYWVENDTNKIAEYCQNDVITLCKLLLKMMGKSNNNQLSIEITPPSINN